ncbi:hypothetical protein, partial [uncultured Bacteroides sp.]|uniref:hypothetical protein n=1 Tax=uncultured Bacteroides sp. TaxID=162156 RepID=UPI002591D7BF
MRKIQTGSKVLKYLLNTYFGTHIRKLDFTFLLHVPTASLNEKAVYLLHLLTTARQTFAVNLYKEYTSLKSRELEELP